MTGVSAKQIHHWSLLVGATIALAFSAWLPWLETDTRVYSGLAEVGSEGWGFVGGWDLLVVVLDVLLIAILVVAPLCRPYLFSNTLAIVFGSIAAALTLGLLALMLVAGSSELIEVRGGIVLATVLAGGLCAL